MISPTRPGTLIAGKYRVKSVLGSGGMGVVVMAEQIALRRDVAIKLIHPHAAAASGGQRLIREARAAARLESPHAVRIFDVDGMAEGQPFIVMELLKGHDLAEGLKLEGPLPVSRAADLLLQALDALAEAHSLGIVHRDLKPSNLFVSRTATGVEHLTVLDFGIAKVDGAFGEESAASHSGFLGTPHYASPEQLNGAPIDVRSDVWSLGVTLHELVSGRRPYRADTLAALLALIQRDPPVPLKSDAPELPEALGALIAECLERDPARRPRDAVDLARRLAPFASPSGRAAGARVAEVARSSPPRAIDAEGLSHPRASALSSESGEDGTLAAGRSCATSTIEPTSRKLPRWMAAAVALAGIAASTWVLRANRPASAPPVSPSVVEAPLAAAPAVIAAHPASSSISSAPARARSPAAEHQPERAPPPPSKAAPTLRTGARAAKKAAAAPRVDAGAARSAPDIEKAIETRY